MFSSELVRPCSSLAAAPAGTLIKHIFHPPVIKGESLPHFLPLLTPMIIFPSLLTVPPLARLVRKAGALGSEGSNPHPHLAPTAVPATSTCN